MQVRDWVDMVMREGMVCPEYMRKLAACSDNGEFFRVLADANGGAWLFGLHARGVELPVDAFCREFGRYLNGDWEVVYPQGYTSKMYCRHEGDMVADTTLVWLLECMDVDVEVPRNCYPTVVLSDGSRAEIAMGYGSRLNIELYGDAEYSVSGDMSRVRVVRH